jgi:hypothetical protein
MITTDERAPSERREQDLKLRQAAINTRVAMPGIIQSFDATEQTVTVQCAIREKINMDGNLSWQDIPLLLDVPIIFPRAGNYILTMPIQAGDECLVVFGDSCMDAWWQSGGVQNQIDCRRHDLSDGYAIVGLYSQPRRIANYSTNTAQLRNLSGSAYVELDGTTINIVGSEVNINAPTVNVNGQNTTITGRTVIDGKTSITSETDIQGRDFISHTHSGVMTGGGNTGGVN